MGKPKLQGLKFQVTLECPACSQPLHVQGFSEVHLCPSCNREVNLDVATWVGWFSPGNVYQATRMREGEQQDVAQLGSSSAKYLYGRQWPQCGECGTFVPRDIAALAGTGHTCDCGERISVRPANDLARVVVPGAGWLVNEGAVGTTAGGAPEAAEPVLFACMGCGGSLKVDGSSRNITCEYCSANNFLPDGLWLRLHPPSIKRTLFVVLEKGSKGDVNPELLARLAVSDDSDVRAAAASNEALALEHLQRLAKDRDSDVRRAATTNENLPQDLLDALVNDRDYDVRVAAIRSGRASTEALAKRMARETDNDVLKAVRKRKDLDPIVVEALARNPDNDARVAAARHPNCPQHVLDELVSQSNYSVRRAAVASGRVSTAALAAQMANERDNDVLGAVADLDNLDPSVLLALAQNDDYDARRVAARHPDTPPDTLRLLSDDRDDDVLRALSTRSDLPGDVMVKLAGSEDAQIAARAQSNPEYTEALWASRKRTALFTLVGGCLLAVVATGVGTVSLGVMGAKMLVDQLQAPKHHSAPHPRRRHRRRQ